MNSIELQRVLASGRRVAAIAMLAASAGALNACMSASTAPRPPVKTTVHAEPAPAPVIAPQGTLEPPAPTPLPSLNQSNLAISEAPARRIDSLTAPAGSSVGDVVRELGKQFGMNVLVDPEVQKTVTARLTNVTLDEALQQIVRNNGYVYQIQGRTLRVMPARLETRLFTLDYVAISRVGTANTTVQRRFTSASSGGQTIGGSSGLSPSGAGAAGAGLSGGDVISATTVSDLWTELRVALIGLLGENTTGNAAVSAGVTSTPGGGGGGAGTVGGAYSQTWPTGTSLTLSPGSGLITVTATPEKLAQIDTYISAL
jgi:type II secretory pathway component GspD/PulD (secretin)